MFFIKEQNTIGKPKKTKSGIQPRNRALPYRTWWGAASPVLNDTPVVYTTYNRTRIRNVHIYIHIYINTELLDENQGVLKELFMDRCVLLTSTPVCVVSPRRAITKAQISTAQTNPWLIQIITWCRQFSSLSANILLIKSTLKLQWRAIAVGVTMLTRKYPCRLHPQPRNWTPFFAGSRACYTNCARSGGIAWRQRRRSCGVFKSCISVALGPFQWKWRDLHIWYISVLEQVGMSFDGIPYLMKV